MYHAVPRILTRSACMVTAAVQGGYIGPKLPARGMPVSHADFVDAHLISPGVPLRARFALGRCKGGGAKAPRYRFLPIRPCPGSRTCSRGGNHISLLKLPSILLLLLFLMLAFGSSTPPALVVKTLSRCTTFSKFWSHRLQFDCRAALPRRDLSS